MLRRGHASSTVRAGPGNNLSARIRLEGDQTCHRPCTPVLQPCPTGRNLQSTAVASPTVKNGDDFGQYKRPETLKNGICCPASRKAFLLVVQRRLSLPRPHRGPGGAALIDRRFVFNLSGLSRMPIRDRLPVKAADSRSPNGKQKATPKSGFLSGYWSGKRIRTSGPCVPNAVLYQAELFPVRCMPD